MANNNNRIEYICESIAKSPEDFVAKCEERYVNRINGVCDEITANGSSEIVMLAGPSAAGKTTTARKISQRLENLGHKAYTVSLDDFYLNPADIPLGDNGKADFETVYALDIPLIEKCFKELIENGKSSLPIFDFKLRQRFLNANDISLNKGDVIIVEGLHALNPIITDFLPNDSVKKIYINVSSRIYDNDDNIILNKRNMRFVRRLVRDFNFRSSSPEYTFELWQNVMKGEDKFLFPFKPNADILINSIHLYETCVLKDSASEMLSGIPSDSIYKKDADKLLKSLNKFPSISKDIIPADSLLREFTGE